MIDRSRPWKGERSDSQSNGNPRGKISTILGVTLIHSLTHSPIQPSTHPHTHRAGHPLDSLITMTDSAKPVVAYLSVFLLAATAAPRPQRATNERTTERKPMATAAGDVGGENVVSPPPPCSGSFEAAKCPMARKFVAVEKLLLKPAAAAATVPPTSSIRERARQAGRRAGDNSGNRLKFCSAWSADSCQGPRASIIVLACVTKEEPQQDTICIGKLARSLVCGER